MLLLLRFLKLMLLLVSMTANFCFLKNLFSFKKHFIVGAFATVAVVVTVVTAAERVDDDAIAETIV
jgi:hypothetical protein